MNNIIIRENSSEIRAIARNALRENWVKVAIAMAVYYLMTTTIPALLTVIMPFGVIREYNPLLENYVDISYLTGLYDFVLEGAFSLGMCSFMLSFFRARDINPGYIFNGFEHFVKAFCLAFMVGLFTFLWGLLLVVPGIIAFIRYSQAFFILEDHPEMGVMDCIAESKRIMTGNKARYFCMHLSFIGWAILAGIPGGLLLTDALSNSIAGSGIIGIVVDFILSIPAFFYMAYINTADAAFYELGSGHLVAQREPEFREEDYHF